MELSLYTNESEDIRLEKKLSNIVTFTGTLKENCSILNPVITVSEFNNAMAAICNYAFIPEFARYYFVTDIISLANNLWEIHLRVDVLQSFAGQIKAQKATIIRQENKYNMLLADGLFKQQQNYTVQLKNIECPFNDMYYIFCKAGG